MVEVKRRGYNFYPEKLAMVALQHNLILPGEEREFERFVRGC